MERSFVSSVSSGLEEPCGPGKVWSSEQRVWSSERRV